MEKKCFENVKQLVYALIWCLNARIDYFEIKSINFE